MALESVGAFWKKEKNGKTFYSGQIEMEKAQIVDGKIQILLYKNDYKEEDKHPDLKIFQIQDDEQQAPQQEQRQTVPDDDSELDIPF